MATQKKIEKMRVSKSQQYLFSRDNSRRWGVTDDFWLDVGDEFGMLMTKIQGLQHVGSLSSTLGDIEFLVNLSVIDYGYSIIKQKLSEGDTLRTCKF